MKPAVLPLNTEFSQPAPFIKACSARSNPSISTFIGAPGISLALFLSRFGAVEPYFPFSVSSPFHECLLPTSAGSDFGQHPHLLSFPFRHRCSKTFITFRMSTALYPPPLSQRWANSSTTSTFVGALGVSLALSPPFRRHKATCSVNSSTPRLGFPRRLFIHFYDTFFSLRHLSLDYSLLHCVANNLSFPLVFLPDLGL
jgi:hypothetical protein